jgi:hypothetical protein
MFYCVTFGYFSKNSVFIAKKTVGSLTFNGETLFGSDIILARCINTERGIPKKKTT